MTKDERQHKIAMIQFMTAWQIDWESKDDEEIERWYRERVERHD